MQKESKEKQAIWGLELQIIDLVRQLNAAGSNNARLEKERGEAVKARYADQEAAGIASQQLAIKTAEVKALTRSLNETTEQMGRLSNNHTVAVTEITTLRPQLVEALAKNASLTTQAETDRGLIDQLRTDNKALRIELDRRETVDAENAILRTELKDWKRQARQASSQAGNFLVGTGRIPVKTYVLKFLCGMPIFGHVFSDVSSRLHRDYQNKRHKPG